MDDNHPLAAAVDDELIRHRVRKLIEKPSSTSFWTAFSKNPLVQIVIGFLLTGFLSNYITKRWSEEQQERERIRDLRELHVRSIERLSQIFTERRTAAGMLRSALASEMPVNDLRARKAYYDSTYVRWNRDVMTIMFTIRSIVGAKDFSKHESYVDEGLAPAFRRMDEALTRVYVARILERPLAQGDSSLQKVRSDLSRADACIYSITNALWVHANAVEPDDPEWKTVRWNTQEELARLCPKDSP
jgi:hypothetical protein